MRQKQTVLLAGRESKFGFNPLGHFMLRAGVKFAPFSGLLHTPNPKTQTPKPLVEKGANLTFAMLRGNTA